MQAYDYSNQHHQLTRSKAPVAPPAADHLLGVLLPRAPVELLVLRGLLELAVPQFGDVEGPKVRRLAKSVSKTPSERPRLSKTLL